MFNHSIHIGIMKKLYFILSIVLLAAIAFPVEAATWSAYNIMLDPGHGGSDPGAGGPSAPHEATLCLRAATSLKNRIVNECGGTVKMTRTGDTSLSLTARRDMSVSYDPYIFCSLHLNAFNTTAKGTETWYYWSTGNSLLLANKVQPRLIEQFKKVSGYTPTNRGVKQNGWTVITGSSNVPAILTEGLFVDNPTEWGIINDESKQGFKMWVQGHLFGFYDRLVLLNSSITVPGSSETPADTQKPSIARCTTVAEGSDSFYAYAYATDNVKVTSVKFPTWTDANGQDDLASTWPSGSSGSWTVGGQSYNWRYLVKASDHNNEKGKYTVHVYAYDAAGNQVSAGTSFTFAPASIKYSPSTVKLEADYGSTATVYADVTITGTNLENDIAVKSSTSAVTVTTQSGWNARTGGKLRFTLNTNFTSGPGEYTDKYVAVESGAGSAKVRVQIPLHIILKSTGPSISVSPASLTFSGVKGTAIASQKITVTGSNLTAAPTLTKAADNFDVESSLTATGGTITVTPKAGLAIGEYSGKLTIAGDGVTKEVSLKATITDKPVEPDVTYGNVKFYLQGGKLDVPADNAALWELFKPDYNTYYGLTRADQPIANVSTFANATMQDFMTNAKSTWKWLGDYIIACSGSDNPSSWATPEGAWRCAVHAFFNTLNDHKMWTASGNYFSADFTTAGKPAAWQGAYTIAHKPTKANATFKGWFTNAAGTGTALTSCPASGEVYACWTSNATTDVANVENAADIKVVPTMDGIEVLFAGTAPVAVYTVNGVMVAGGVAYESFSCDLQGGMYIIRVGNEVVKVIR